MTMISQNICRICEKNSSKLIDVAAPQFQSLIGKYLSCANVEFDVNDKLPKYFCEICIDLLNISHDFKEQCERTYNKLLLILQTIETNPISDSVEIKEETAEDNGFYQHLFDSETSKNEFLPINEIESKVEVLLQTNVTPLKTYKCYICNNNFTYKSKRTLSKHIRLKHNFKNVDKTSINVKSEIANKCEPKTNSNRKKSIFLKTFECYICKNFTYKTRASLFVHMHLKHDFGREKKDLKCDLCNYQTTVSYYLGKHRKRHFVDKSITPKFTCEKCGKTFSFINNMRRHIIDVHQKEKRFECNICGAKYSRLCSLQLHLSTHSDERNFNCEHCGKSFKSKIRLKCHSVVHLPRDQKYKKRPHEEQICEICGKSMFYTQMYVHMRRHMGTHLTHECKFCSKKFVHKHELIVHTYVHTGERPIKCKLCPKTFRQSSHLTEHNKTHTNIRPYKCRFCEKAFKQRSNLREHERIHTGEKPYSCNLCQMRFANSPALRKHAKTMHPENEEAAITVKKRGELLKKSF